MRVSSSFCYPTQHAALAGCKCRTSHWQRFEKEPLKLVRHEERRREPHGRNARDVRKMTTTSGRLLAGTRGGQARRNTIVMYFSDNGPNGARWNGGMKGQKRSTGRGGKRLLRMLAREGEGRHRSEPRRCGVDPPPHSPTWRAERSATSRSTGSASPRGCWARSGNTGPRAVQPLGRAGERESQLRLDMTGQLFDMVSDPNQTKNVAADFERTRSG